MDNDDVILWLGAKKVELESMYGAQDLIEGLEGIKPIECKWVYKRKKEVNGNVKTYKARLVVKGYSQKLGFDYEEIFSPVAMIKSIRILLSIATHLNYEL